jgi:Asp-tRNA(Asn)/Glu-tRNA(Gln) amidotransferase A subunit family amidase
VLRGIGIGVKDVIGTVDLPTGMGSSIHAGQHAGANAECITRLQNAGGYVFGKTVTTAFAYMDAGKTRNPWNVAHTPGGSSSGSAAAVAAGHVAGAMGTQTNGSVIRPAAFCGVVGFKPTKDAIPFTGVHLFSDTLDQLGVFARSVADAARVSSALSVRGFVSCWVGALPAAPRLALLRGFPWVQVDREALDALQSAATRLRQFGATVSEVEFPARWRHANRAHRTIMLYEAALNMGPLQERERARLTPKLNAGLDEGRAIAGEEYRRDLDERVQAIGAFGDWMEDFDAVLCPPASGAAPAGLDVTGDPACCTLWSLTGFPALTLPVGLTSAGLPLGMQIACPAGADDRLLAVAAWCESKLSFRGLV